MPTRYPRVLAVDAPTTTANVLYDFQDDLGAYGAGSKTALHADEWSFGQLDLLGDPDAVGVEWALQQISFSQEITGTKAAAMARQQAMSKALLRRRFWVQFQLTASTTPAWWYAYRTPPGNLSLDSVYVDGSLTDRWQISGSIDVDAFSWAARVTHSSKTVGNNPANEPTTPATGYNLPTIKGDAPTRLRLTIKPSTSSSTNASQRWLVALVSSDRAAPILRSPIGGSDGFTAFNGTSASTSVSDAVGGTARTVTFTNPTLLTRLTGAVPLAGAPGPTRYLVLLRCAATDGTNTQVPLTFQMRGYFADQPAVAPMTSAVLGQASGGVKNYQYVSLGVVAIGDGLPVGVSAPSSRSVSFALGASSTTTVATLDDLIFIPVAGQGVASASVLMTTLGLLSAGPSNGLWLDGDDEISWLNGVGEGLFTTSNAGGFPTADPAAAYNTLFAAPVSDTLTTGSTSATALTATATIDVSYQPRSSWIGDGAT